MARADLHQAFAIDREVYEAARVDRAVLDPVIITDGGVPGTARPFLVVREYQGPQGTYVERFELSTAEGRVLVASSPARIDLSGEAFEDRFLSELRNVEISTLDEHRLTFWIGEDEVGGVPVFVQPAGGGSARTAVETTFETALKKSTILWVTVPEHGTGRRGRTRVPEVTRPVWFVAQGDHVYLLTGPDEQELPGIATAPHVRLHARAKDTRSLIADIECSLEVVPPDDERWDDIAQKAATRRLNLSDEGDATLRRWRETCTMLELTPQFGEDRVDPAEIAAAVGGGDGAEAAQQADATPDRSDEIHVEAEVDQEVMDQLLSEGVPERVARAKAKAHYVRTERERIRAEREGGGNGEDAGDGEPSEQQDAQDVEPASA